MENKAQIFEEAGKLLENNNLSVESCDDNRPWGGFFVIHENSAEAFIDTFFPDLDKGSVIKGKISPKILLVAPQKKLSWQYHFRRSEIWKLIKGEAAIITSPTDTEGEQKSMVMQETVYISKGERHRLIGLQDWGFVAEIWMHTDAENPSDEDDIVRLNDEFGRK